MRELVQELVTVSMQELQQAAEEEPRMVVQDLVQGAEEEPRPLKEPVMVSVQELVQGVEDKPRVVRELVVPASRVQDWSSTSPHLDQQTERFSTISSKIVTRI
jgi:hypothetical protein